MRATHLRERALIGLIKHGARVIDGPGRQFVPLHPRGLLNAARRRTKLEDFDGDFDDFPPAVAFVLSRVHKDYPEDPWPYRWAHVYDIIAARIVWRDGSLV